MSTGAALRPLPWQQAPWRQLAEARRQGRFAHAWIVSGVAGVGKKQFVGALAAALLCGVPDAGGQACGVCESCRMLLAGGHPDAHLICRDGHLGLAWTSDLQRPNGITHFAPKPESKRKEIAVDAVRSLIDDKLPLAAHRGGAKVAVIIPADLLNLSSADALLKTVEEPRQSTTILLVTEQAMSLSATLRSRCQRLRLALPGREEGLAWLAQTLPETSESRREAALGAARGAPLLAAARLQSSEATGADQWSEALDEFLQGRGDPLKLASSVDSERTIDFLHAAQVWLAARLTDDLARTKPWTGSAMQARIEPVVEEMIQAHRRLESNVRGQLVLEAMLIAWRRWLAPGAPASSESGMMTNTSRQ